jgi:hypothetical protein
MQRTWQQRVTPLALLAGWQGRVGKVVGSVVVVLDGDIWEVGVLNVEGVAARIYVFALEALHGHGRIFWPLKLNQSLFFTLLIEYHQLCDGPAHAENLEI